MGSCVGTCLTDWMVEDRGGRSLVAGWRRGVGGVGVASRRIFMGSYKGIVCICARLRVSGFV